MMRPHMADEDPLEVEGAPSSEVAIPKRRVWPFVVLALMVLVAGGVIGGALWLRARIPELLRERVLEEADRRGIVLTYGGLEGYGLMPWEDGPRIVILTDIKATLRDAPGIEVEAARVEVPLKGYEPERMKLTKLWVAAPDVPSLVALEREVKEGRLGETPAAVDGATIRIARVAESVPFAVLARLTSAQVDDGVLDLEGLTLEVPFLGRTIGPLAVDLEREDGRSWIVPHDFREARIGLDDDARQARGSIKGLRHDKIARLLEIDMPEVTVTGSADVTLAGKNAPRAKFGATLDGFIPPHPRELDGIVFGKKTDVSGTARVDGARILFDEIIVEAGALKLKGEGVLDIGQGGTISLDLRGGVPCAELATSVISSKLGLMVGGIAGDLARGRVQGTVAVRVTVEGTVGDIDKAKVVPYAELRCKIVLKFP
jgi:hypothetical protein